MTFDEIKKNAPDGATHYAHVGDWSVIYYKPNEEHKHFILGWAGDRWVPARGVRARFLNKL